MLFGGAGEVKARGERRRVRSDWMAVERERGISVSSAVMSFEHDGLAFNLLDTPGPPGFQPKRISADTCRTLTAVPQLFLLPRWYGAGGVSSEQVFGDMGGLGLMVTGLGACPRWSTGGTREGRDPFDLLDEIEQSLALDVTPASRPLSMGRDFLGTYDLFTDALLLVGAAFTTGSPSSSCYNGLDDPQLPCLLPKQASLNCCSAKTVRCAPQRGRNANCHVAAIRTAADHVEVCMSARKYGEKELPVNGVSISTAPSVLTRVTPLGPK